jgi:hypothetical protein
MSTPKYIQLLVYNHLYKPIVINFNVSPERIGKFVVEIPPPLRHLFVLESSFGTKPKTDESGCFTWALDYGITLSDFTNIIFFLENGKLPFDIDIENPISSSSESRLSDFFTIFGGCYEYDKYRLSQNNKRENIRKMSTPDPCNPQSALQDIYQLFNWSCSFHSPSNNWCYIETKDNPADRIWRKAKTIEEITAEKEARDFVRNQPQSESELDDLDE